jgi:alpha-1,3-rhamnosyl/mannosyltransferase
VSRLRVGVNLLWLVPGVVGGSEEYTVQALLGLAQRNPGDLDVHLYGLEALAAAHPDLAAAFPLRSLRLEGRLKPGRVAAESSWLVAQARRDRIEVLHHAGGVIPPGAWPTTVVTVYDIQPLEFPHYFSGVKRRWLAAMLPRAVRKADVVATMTEFVRASLVDRLGADPDRVMVVPPCLIPRPAPSGSSGDLVLGRGIARPFAVYNAITYPHKNHALLVDALARLGGRPLDLVLPSGAAGAEEALAARIAAAGVQRRVHRLGRIPRDDLDALVSASAGLVFPSTYEGFGMPVLEAMAAGVPVVVSNAAALPEVAGGAALLLDPHDVAAWAAALGDLAAGRGAAVEAARAGAGRARAASFTPDRTAAALHAVYRAAARR